MDLFGDLPEPDSAGKTEKVLLPTSPPPKAPTETNVKLENVAEKRKLVEQTHTEHSEEKKQKVDMKDLKYKFRLKGYVADRQGEREDMQDSHIIMDDFTHTVPHLHPDIQRLSMYAVFDGHGGVRASRFATQHLHNNLRDKFPKGDVAQTEKEIKKVLIEVFKKIDEDFLKEAKRNKPTWKDGSTAVVVLAINDTLYIANLGDSKAILCRYKESEGRHVAVPLSADHSPSLWEERMRIQKAGGYVKEGRVMGQLEVSRSLGDGPYKNHGVTCVPDIKRCSLTSHDKFLMIACDGLWKKYSADESIQEALRVLEEGNKSAPGDARYNEACGRLASSAVLRLSGDNVTVMLVSVAASQGSAALQGVASQQAKAATKGD